MPDGHVPTEVYSRLLDQRGQDQERIKALESMLRDAWLVCQGGRVVGDSYAVRVLTKRVEAWKSVLDAVPRLSDSPERGRAMVDPATLRLGPRAPGPTPEEIEAASEAFLYRWSAGEADDEGRTGFARDIAAALAAASAASEQGQSCAECGGDGCAECADHCICDLAPEECPEHFAPKSDHQHTPGEPGKGRTT